MTSLTRTLALLMTAALPAHAIIVRHDVADERFRDQARSIPEPVVLLRAPRGAANGHGVYLGDGWFLTAAHVAADLDPDAGIPGHPEWAVCGIRIHPRWQPGSPDDLALIQVRGPISLEPIRLADRRPEVGEQVFVIGRGDTGTGLTGPGSADGVLRAGTNRVTARGPAHLEWRFDSPDQGADPLEAVSGPGDSGGPAYLNDDGVWRLAGISSGQDGGGHGPGRYGATEYYADVVAQRAWIDSARAEPACREES